MAPGSGPTSGTAAWMSAFNACQPQRLKSARSFRSWRKKRRRILGIESTKCLQGKVGITWVHTHRPKATARF
jgi:hypothetical protein